MKPICSGSTYLWLTALSLSLLCAPLVWADDVNLTATYPNPFGEYPDLTITDTLSVGKKQDALGVATVFGNMTINGPENLLVYGELLVDGGTLHVDADPVAPYDYLADSRHWVKINKPASNALAEFDVNGPIYAPSYRAADNVLANFISLDTFNDTTTVPASVWGRLLIQEPSGWNNYFSSARIIAQPKIVLNYYSQGKLLIGTATAPVAPSPYAPPEWKVFVMDGYNTRAHDITWSSSRMLKQDIVPLGRADYGAVLDALSRMDAIRFRYVWDAETVKPRLGVLAEESPRELLDDAGQGIEVNQLIGFLLATVKAIEMENQQLEAQITALEAEEAAAP
jgi:hypothetical protein